MDTDNQTNESDTTSLAEQRRGTVLDSAADIAQRESQSSDNGTVPDSGADRAVAGEDVAERVREEMGLDNPAPFDAGADLGELVRATYGGRAKDAQEEDAQEEDAAPHERDDGDAERDGVDQELTPIQAVLARLRRNQERSKKPAARLRPVPRLRRRPSDGLVGGTGEEQGARRSWPLLMAGGEGVRARVRTHSMNTGEYRRPSRPVAGRD